MSPPVQTEPSAGAELHSDTTGAEDSSLWPPLLPVNWAHVATVLRWLDKYCARRFRLSFVSWAAFNAPFHGRSCMSNSLAFAVCHRRFLRVMLALSLPAARKEYCTPDMRGTVGFLLILNTLKCATQAKSSTPVYDQHRKRCSVSSPARPEDEMYAQMRRAVRVDRASQCGVLVERDLDRTTLSAVCWQFSYLNNAYARLMAQYGNPAMPLRKRVGNELLEDIHRLASADAIAYSDLWHRDATGALAQHFMVGRCTTDFNEQSFSLHRTAIPNSSALSADDVATRRTSLTLHSALMPVHGNAGSAVLDDPGFFQLRWGQVGQLAVSQRLFTTRRRSCDRASHPGAPHESRVSLAVPAGRDSIFSEALTASSEVTACAAISDRDTERAAVVAAAAASFKFAVGDLSSQRQPATSVHSTSVEAVAHICESVDAYVFGWIGFRLRRVPWFQASVNPLGFAFVSSLLAARPERSTATASNNNTTLARGSTHSTKPALDDSITADAPSGHSHRSGGLTYLAPEMHSWCAALASLIWNVLLTPLCWNR